MSIFEACVHMYNYKSKLNEMILKDKKLALKTLNPN